MNTRKIAILQSNYIPWKGYFDIIAKVDEFIFYDDVQYTKNDWRNRNKIKTKTGLQWLTIPVETKGRLSNKLKISEVQIADDGWAKKHLTSIKNAYIKSPFFIDYYDFFEDLYQKCLKEKKLCQINYIFINAIIDLLDIKTKISFVSDYTIQGDKNERLIDLCKQVNATEYISGLAAKSYLDENLMHNAGIKITWFDYSHYPQYTQLHGDFCHNVSIIDLLFNTGKNAKNYMLLGNK